MFRNMQNAEIIRKMTEEFDEVTVCSSEKRTQRELNVQEYLLEIQVCGLSVEAACTVCALLRF